MARSKYVRAPCIVLSRLASSSPLCRVCVSDWYKQLTQVLHADTINPKHIVFATGASGKPFMPDIPGLSSFKGDRLVHSSDYHGLGNAARGEGKKVVIIGSCNSAHDVAQDYYDHGYSVTVVQRSSTFVVRKQTLIDVVLGGLYRENGVSIRPLADSLVVVEAMTYALP